MCILIVNDDGVIVFGIVVFYDVLVDYVDCVVIVFDQDKSGVSSFLMLDCLLYLQCLDNGFISFNGMLIDCVYLGLNGLLEELLDMVVLGINLGVNFGDDVFYFGIVVVVIEGCFLKGLVFVFLLVLWLMDNLFIVMYFVCLLVFVYECLVVLLCIVFNVNILNLLLDCVCGI